MKIYKITKEQINWAIDDPLWQEFRINLKGLPLETKIKKLRLWYKKSMKAEIQVINYWNALKRAGLIKK